MKLVSTKFAIAAVCALLVAFAHVNCHAAALEASYLPRLPQPVANNAVATVTANNTQYIVSFAGMGAGRDFVDIHAKTFVLADNSAAWAEQPPIPGKAGRLAATATAVGRLAYVFGGYTVAEDGTETSTPWVHSFDPVTSRYIELAPMPLPVDDAVSVSYADRYIYLISGWHDLGNVNLVQRYDTMTDTWAQATPLPGKSLFGHAGGIVGNNLLYCDGVAVLARAQQSRSFVASDECFLGIINDQDSRRIDWRPIAKHPGAPRYRMAAAGIPERNAILFLGGSENPYNYNGIGYDGKPSEPTGNALLFDLETQTWQILKQDNQATMDHRGLIPFKDQWLTIGGMLDSQIVTDTVVGYSFTSAIVVKSRP